MSKFGVLPQERVSLYIDGSNLYSTGKALGFDIDYKALRAHFDASCRLVRANFFTTILEQEEGHVSIKPLLDWLDYNGFNVVTKYAKEFIDREGRRKIKGSMDIEMAVHMMEAAKHCDHLVLFSGDGDFRSLVEAVQRQGCKVTVASTMKTQAPMISDELRRQADGFVDLSTLRDVIGKEPVVRAARVDA